VAASAPGGTATPTVARPGASEHLRCGASPLAVSCCANPAAAKCGPAPAHAAPVGRQARPRGGTGTQGCRVGEHRGDSGSGRRHARDGTGRYGCGGIRRRRLHRDVTEAAVDDGTPHDHVQGQAAVHPEAADGAVDDAAPGDHSPHDGCPEEEHHPDAADPVACKSLSTVSGPWDAPPRCTWWPRPRTQPRSWRTGPWSA